MSDKHKANKPQRIKIISSEPHYWHRKFIGKVIY